MLVVAATKYMRQFFIDQWVAFRGGFVAFSQTPFGSGLIGALVGGFFTLFGVVVQSILESRKESETERNKLVYLNFLLDDTYKAVNWYDVQSQKVMQSIRRDPFWIPDFPLYPIHSLESIVNKINQEEYYLAFVNQTEDQSLTEILLICNTIYRQYNNGTGHYKNEFDPLVEEKKLYTNMLNGLRESLNQYYKGMGEGRRLSGDEAIIYKGLVSLSDSVKKLYSIESAQGATQMLYRSRSVLVDPMVTILNPRGEQSHGTLLKQAMDVERQYKTYVGRINNVIDVVERNRVMMNKEVSDMKVISKPLKKYLGK